MRQVIHGKDELKALWEKTWNAEGRPDWSHILPYYRDDVHFRDAVQELRGIGEFRAMTERLAKRSGTLKMEITGTAQEGREIFLEWVMTLSFKKMPSSSIYGCSKVSLDDEGMIKAQRDYYDLWGDISDNVPLYRKAYRAFMRLVFG